MKILKILGIAAAVHGLALLLIFANPGCSTGKAASTDSSPISAAPTPPPGASPGATISVPDSVGIRYSPTRPGTPVAAALETQPVADVTPASTYAVTRGDSLYSIAKKNGLTKAELAAANNLKPSAALHVGQKLVIPTKAATAATGPAAGAPATTPDGTTVPAGPVTEATKHVVKAGETLGGIARRYGVRQGELAVANNITDPKKIQPGQELVIPAHSASTKGSKAAKAPADTAAAPKPAAAAAADQDLDAGLKPATDVPVVKIEDSTSPQPKNP
jgi:LysM repeat protein